MIWNFIKYIFNISYRITFIIFLLFFFYWQGQNSYIYFYQTPRILKIGIPQNIYSLAYKTLNNEYKGEMINLCNYFFIDLFDNYIVYDLIDSNNKNIFKYNIIINQKKENSISDLFLFSQKITDQFDFVSIKLIADQKNPNQNTIGALNNNVLFHFKLDSEDYFFIDSLFDIVKNFDNNIITEFILEKNLYENFLNVLKIYNIDEKKFTYKKIKKKIKPIYFLFHYKLYWLIKFFNKLIYFMEDV